MSEIQFNNVTKHYGDHAALAGVSLTIEKDTTTAVIGPSGGGKSTLLQLVNGLVVPDSGSVTVLGKPIDYSRLTELRAQIGYAVQGTGLFPHMSVWKNITLLAKIARWDADRIEARASSLMSTVGLPERFRERHPHELSGGEQQRVGLCRAMMLNPRLFILDEPFGALDPITRSAIHEEFLQLQASEPRTMVLVTHDLREAIKLASRLVILNEGRVVQDGSREEILNAPSDPLVVELLRSQLDAWGKGH